MMSDATPEQKTTGKGKATPSRKQAEAARVRPLVTDRTPEGRAAAKEKAKAERARIRAGQAAGDDRYLPIRDRGPQKRFAREVVDSRLTVGEFMVPVFVVALLLSFVDPTHPTSALNASINILILTTFFLIAVDSFAIYLTVTRKGEAKFGKLERGTSLYAIVRGTQPRFMRLPKPATGPMASYRAKMAELEAKDSEKASKK
jgi:hypothetical protein